jgi:signal transduction histidine kinase
MLESKLYSKHAMTTSGTEKLARPRRSISIPITLGVVSVALSIGLLVGWILVIVQDLSLIWLLVLGSASFVVIITVLVLFSVFLVREIRMVNRQTGFVDSVTHELKSPLASLKLCLETLERDDLASEQRVQLRQMMLDDVERLSIFIEDVIEASRLPDGREGYALDRVVVSELVKNCADGIARSYKQAPETIQVRIPPDLVLVTDKTALETVIKNVLDNAVKYSLGLDLPVDVRVETVLETRDVNIRIRDQGVGIPREHRKRIFERFFRVPHESVRSRRGTGLGLFVVSSLVRVLGGKLQVDSGGIGRGTLVQIRVPRNDPEENAFPPEDTKLTVSEP